jgi:hypothetical protein
MHFVGACLEEFLVDAVPVVELEDGLHVLTLFYV